MNEKEAVRINWNQSETWRVRRSVDIIALTILAEMGINCLLYPIMPLFPHAAQGSFFYELEDMLTYLLIFVIPFAVGARLSGMSFRDLMGRGKPSAEVYVMTLGLTLGWSIAAGWLGAGIEGVLNQYGLTEAADTYVLPDSGCALLVQFLATAIIPPIVEELCYRGFFLNTAVRSMGTWGAIAFTAVCFWLAHDSLEIFPLACGFGIIGGYIRRRYGSLLPSMVAHFAVNTVYIVINASYAYNHTVGAVVSMPVSLLELLIGAVGRYVWHPQFADTAAHDDGGADQRSGTGGAGADDLFYIRQFGGAVNADGTGKVYESSPQAGAEIGGRRRSAGGLRHCV